MNVTLAPCSSTLARIVAKKSARVNRIRLLRPPPPSPPTFSIPNSRACTAAIALAISRPLNPSVSRAASAKSASVRSVHCTVSPSHRHRDHDHRAGPESGTASTTSQTCFHIPKGPYRIAVPAGRSRPTYSPKYFCMIASR